jgi:hypothetical protein
MESATAKFALFTPALRYDFSGGYSGSTFKTRIGDREIATPVRQLARALRCGGEGKGSGISTSR